MAEMFFQDAWSVLRVVVAAICCYVALVSFLRISGKRTLTKMNAFDLIVTVAIGSTLAAAIVQRDTPIVNGIMALGMLILLQYVVATLQRKSERFQQLIKSQPSLLLYRGRLQQEMLRRERVTEAEVHAAIRNQGFTSMEGIFAVILETDGSFTVIESPQSGLGALRAVQSGEVQLDAQERPAA